MRFSKWLAQWVVPWSKYELAVSLSLLACASHVSAQDQQLTPPKIEGKVIFGSSIFNNDSEHKVVGGAVRVYVTKRLSIEPEYLYLRHSENDQDHLLQPNIAFDITDPTKRFVPYAIAGAGVLHHKGRFVGSDFATGAPRVVDVSLTGWTVSAGGGVKIFLTDRLCVSPEFRVGREPTVRATVSVGYVFAGRQ